MNVSKTRAHRLAPMVIASLGVWMSACGPQDGTPAKAPVAAAPAQVEAQAAAPAPVVEKPAAQVVPRPPAPVVEKKPVALASADAGAVKAIEAITEAKPSGAGAVVGGVLGGVVGNQFGKGDGKKAMTVVGAVGGAVAGHEIEKSRNRKIVGYRVQVQLDNGQTRTFQPNQLDGLKVGDRVRIDQGTLRKA